MTTLVMTQHRSSGLSASVTRISALLLRYVFLHRRNLIRAFDIFFWPVMDLLIWGFLTLYIQQNAVGSIAQFIIFLIGALIAWDIHYRGQQAITISLMEEIWTQNITNMLIAPIRLWEWLTASFLYGLIKVSLVTLILAGVAKLLYAFDLARVGWAFVPLVANLLIFGWAIGMATSGLLLRFGYAAEALIWGIPFLLQPFSCVFYPLSILPRWAQVIARGLPSTYAFEALRAAVHGEPVRWMVWGIIVGLNSVYMAVGLGLFMWMFRQARATGRLGRLGQD